MKPDFTLALSSQTIQLLHRADAGWHLIGQVSVTAADMAEQLAALRAKALGLGNGAAFGTKILIPNEQIRYLALDTTRATEDDVRAALEGATPYSVNDLVYDFVTGGGRTYIAAAARQTLAEAEAFATAHQMAPLSFCAAPEPFTYLGEAFFGPTRASRDILPFGTFLDRDPHPVAITGAVDGAEVPDDLPPPSIPSFMQSMAVSAAAPDQHGAVLTDGSAPEDGGAKLSVDLSLPPKAAADAAPEAPAPEAPAPEPAAKVEPEAPPKPTPAAEGSLPPRRITLTSPPQPMPAADATPAAEPEAPAAPGFATRRDPTHPPAPKATAPEPAPAPSVAGGFASRRDPTSPPKVPEPAAAAPAPEAPATPPQSPEAPAPQPSFASRREPTFPPRPEPGAVMSAKDLPMEPPVKARPVSPNGPALSAPPKATPPVAPPAAPPAPAAQREITQVAVPLPAAPTATPDVTVVGQPLPAPEPPADPEKTVIGAPLPVAAAGMAVPQPGDVVGKPAGPSVTSGSLPGAPAPAPSATPAPSADVEDSPKAPGFFSRRKQERDARAAQKAASAKAAKGRKADLDDDEKPRVGGKPRFLGLILTVILLIFMAAVAAMAALSEEGLAWLFGRSDPAETQLADAGAEAGADTEADAGDAPVDAALAETETEEAPTEEDIAEATEPVPPAEEHAEVEAETAPDPSQPSIGAAPGLLNADAANGALPEVALATGPSVFSSPVPVAPLVPLADLTGPTAMPLFDPNSPPKQATLRALGTVLSPDEAQRIYAATGVWQRAPRLPVTPRTASLAGVGQAAPLVSPERPVLGGLARPGGFETDIVIVSPPSPPPPGVDFPRDEDGFILATPEGTLTPDGILVFAGAPAVSPPPRDGEPEAEIPARAPAEVIVAEDGLVVLAGAPPVTPPARTVTAPDGSEIAENVIVMEDGLVVLAGAPRLVPPVRTLPAPETAAAPEAPEAETAAPESPLPEALAEGEPATDEAAEAADPAIETAEAPALDQSTEQADALLEVDVAEAPTGSDRAEDVASDDAAPGGVITQTDGLVVLAGAPPLTPPARSAPSLALATAPEGRPVLSLSDDLVVLAGAPAISPPARAAANSAAQDVSSLAEEETAAEAGADADASALANADEEATRAAVDPTDIATLPETAEAPALTEEALRLAAFRPNARPSTLVVPPRVSSDPALAGARPQARPAGLAPPAPEPEPEPEPEPQPEEAPTDQAAAPDAGAASEALAAAISSAVQDAAGQTAPRIVDATRQAVQVSARPDTRPRNFARVVEQARRNQERQETASNNRSQQAAAVPRAAAAAPTGPTPGGVAAAATVENAINLRQVSLIGVYGSASNRRALVRLSNGRYVKVNVGDRLDGGRVAAIGENYLDYTKRGRTNRLEMP